MNIVTHNLPSMYASRQLNITASHLGKSAENLSSGYRINRSSDDAAGLAISEKMRKQIRGLDQGCDNITDGISMAKTAEGALHEITDMLQRINVLSIQAYNDTNSRSDREAIQAEVDQLLTEFDRIRETAKFNETYLLKGNPESTVLLEGPHTVTTYKTKEETFDIPSWLSFDKELKVHSEYQLSQDPNKGIMVVENNVTIGNQVVKERLYYGEDKGNPYKHTDGEEYTYAGAWSPSIGDNYATRISFEGLVSASPDAKTLYENLSKLIGCSIGVPCATCDDEFYGINFLGTLEDGSSAESIGFINRDATVNANLNLTKTQFSWDDGSSMSMFEKVRELIDAHEADNSTLSDQEKESSTQQLSKEIAQKLRDAILIEMDTKDAIGGHYDYVLKDGNYDLYVYDYRDELMLDTSTLSTKTIQASVKSRISTPFHTMSEPVYGEERGVILIQCSSSVEDRIPIELPDISLDSLGLADYSVARYKQIVDVVFHDPLPMSDEDVERIKEYERANIEYQNKVRDYLNEHRSWENDFRETPEDPYLYPNSVTKIIKPKQTEWKWINGEYVEVTTPAVMGNVVQYHKGAPPKAPDDSRPIKPTTQPRGEAGWQYDSATGKFKEYHITEKYDPSSVDLIGEALKTVTSWRSYLGAIQNRLEHTYNNNRNKEENTTAAESRIRDTDMAEEMVRYATGNLLQQAGQTILAQANQQPQTVLQLLR